MEGVNWKTPMNTKMLRNNQGGSISSFEIMLNPYNIFSIRILASALKDFGLQKKDSVLV